MSFFAHLEELRKKIFICLILILAGWGISFSFVEQALGFLIRPAGTLVFVKPTEAFMVRLKVSFVCGLFIVSPFLLQQIWSFVRPALYPHEKRKFYFLIPFSFFLFIAGACFSLFIASPHAIKFLISLETENIKPMISVMSYVSFVLNFTLAFGLVFQMPVIILLLTSLGLVTPRFLSKNRSYSVFIIFVVAAIISPPDVMSLFMMAIPMVVIYEISIIISKFVYRKKQNEA